MNVVGSNQRALDGDKDYTWQGMKGSQNSWSNYISLEAVS